MLDSMIATARKAYNALKNTDDETTYTMLSRELELALDRLARAAGTDKQEAFRAFIK